MKYTGKFAEICMDSLWVIASADVSDKIWGQDQYYNLNWIWLLIIIWKPEYGDSVYILKYVKLPINKESETRKLINEHLTGRKHECRRTKIKLVLEMPHNCRSEKRFIKKVFKRGPNTNHSSIMHLIAHLLHEQKRLIDLPYSLFCHKHSRL